MVEPKQKECANQECEKTFPQFNSLDKWCSAPCKRKCQELKAKKKADSPKQFDELKAAFDVRSKSLPKLESEAKIEFQKSTRWRDRDKGCVSCPSQNALEWHGGHYMKAELYSGVIFDEMNCHKQCRHCNIDLDGNKEGYRAGLILRYGLDYVEAIEFKAKLTRSYKWSREELIEIKAKYRRLNLEAQKQ